MDVMQTLDVVDGPYEEEDSCEDDEGVWGRLFPLRKEFVALNMVKDEYTFGRGEECDYCFETHGKSNSHYLQLSKTHFRIYREKEKNDPSKYTVFVEDKSTNGTFLKGEKIGKHKKQVMNSDDELALALKKNKAFIFNDCAVTSTSDSLPQELTEKYTISKQLGRGACGEVKLVFEKETCTKYAVKIISKKTFSVGPLGRSVKDEVKIMQALKHPCVIHIEDVIDSQEALYIVLELAEGGELFDKVIECGNFSEPLAKLYFYQLLSSVKYLHDQGITHRDLKPENVLLANDDDETLIKVTDFGLSKFVGENSLMQTLCGTPSYLAPEVLQTAGTGGYTKEVDCWSVGVILYIMLGGYPPFSDDNFTLHDQICQGRYSFPDKFWRKVSKDGIDMIKRLMTLDPKCRITSAAALEHPWLQDEKMVAKAEKLMSCCNFKPNAKAKASGMPPPALPTTRKRSAPNSDDEGVAKPAKRATVDTLSPTEEAPPTIELPAESANGLSKNKSSDSTCSVTSNER